MYDIIDIRNNDTIVGNIDDEYKVTITKKPVRFKEIDELPLIVTTQKGDVYSTSSVKVGPEDTGYAYALAQYLESLGYLTMDQDDRVQE